VQADASETHGDSDTESARYYLSLLRIDQSRHFNCEIGWRRLINFNRYSGFVRPRFAVARSIGFARDRNCSFRVSPNAAVFSSNESWQREREREKEKGGGGNKEMGEK